MILAIAIFAASSQPVPAIQASAGATVVYNASATNALATVTNQDGIFTRTEYQGATTGTGVTLSGPTITQIDNYTTNAASVSGTTVSFLAPGPVRLRARLDTGAATYCTSFTTNTAATTTNDVFAEYLPGFLAYTLNTNFIALTNGKTATVWTGLTYGQTNLSGVTWNADGYLTGRQGATAISPASWSGSVMTWTALTPRHAYARGHGLGITGGPTNNPAITNRSVWFLGTNSTAHEMTIAAARTFFDAEDWTLAIFTADLPGDVEPMAIVTNSSLANIQAKMTNTTAQPFQLGGTCQHNLFCSDTSWPIFGNHNARISGDSGAPNFIVLAGRLGFVSGRTTTGWSETMRTNLDYLTTQAGLATTNYQPTFMDLSAFPDL